GGVDPLGGLVCVAGGLAGEQVQLGPDRVGAFADLGQGAGVEEVGADLGHAAVLGLQQDANSDRQRRRCAARRSTPPGSVVGPAVTQPDILDALATLGDQTQPEQRQGKPRRTRRPSRTTTTGADSTGAPESGVLGAAGCVVAGAGCLAQVMPLPGSQRVPSMS